MIQVMVWHTVETYCQRVAQEEEIGRAAW
jgi:hypothetical protein